MNLSTIIEAVSKNRVFTTVIDKDGDFLDVKVKHIFANQDTNTKAGRKIGYEKTDKPTFISDSIKDIEDLRKNFNKWINDGDELDLSNVIIAKIVVEILK